MQTTTYSSEANFDVNACLHQGRHGVIITLQRGGKSNAYIQFWFGCKEHLVNSLIGDNQVAWLNVS